MTLDALTRVRDPFPSVRSYVCRDGRLTRAQSDALNRLWSRYGLATAGLLDFDALFGRRSERILEVGFGDGEHLLARARSEPQSDFIGIDVYRPGAGRLLREAEMANLSNLRVLIGDAVYALRHQMPEAFLDEAVLYFPDPWPKKRHHKRRLVQPDFVQLIARALKPGGVWRLATDWADYALSIREILNSTPEFKSLGGPDGCVERPSTRPLTRFERRGKRLGHTVFDFAYLRRHAVLGVPLVKE